MIVAVRAVLMSWVVVLCGCGSDEGVSVLAESSADGVEGVGEPSSSVNALLPGAGADEAAAEAPELEPASCDPAECPEVPLFGVMAPGCCRFGELCGGRVQISERTSACLAPEVNEQGEELRSALTVASREPFVPDARCPSQVIDGDELQGCCRAGVCGLDTQPWTRSAADYGLLLPRACLDVRQAAELANQPPGTTPPPRCRN